LLYTKRGTKKLQPKPVGFRFWYTLSQLTSIVGSIETALICVVDELGRSRMGFIEFDNADVVNMVSEGSFYSVVLHEIGHVLGLGILWDDHGLVIKEGDVLYYSGPRGNIGNIEVGGTGKAVVEDGYGDGIARLHWKEDIYHDELMTGISESNYMPLSKLTLRALEDLGYSVDLSQADPYTLNSQREPQYKIHTRHLQDRVVNVNYMVTPGTVKTGKDAEYREERTQIP